MLQESDYRHETPNGGICRVRVFEPDETSNPGDHYVVVLSEIPENPGMSITNCVELVAGEIIALEGLPPGETVVIEHRPADARPPEPETFDLLVFARRRNPLPPRGEFGGLRFEGPRSVGPEGSPSAERWRRGGRVRADLGAPEWLRIDRAAVETLVGQRLI